MAAPPVEGAYMAEPVIPKPQCGGCNALLDETPGLLLSQRQPCPNCGSLGRLVHVGVQAEAKVLSSMKAEGVRAGLSRGKGWFKRVFAGQALQRNRDNAVVDVERVFDRIGDRYTETVTIQETGEVIHSTDEPLSRHKGHGSDKTN